MENDEVIVFLKSGVMGIPNSKKGDVGFIVDNEKFNYLGHTWFWSNDHILDKDIKKFTNIELAEDFVNNGFKIIIDISGKCPFNDGELISCRIGRDDIEKAAISIEKSGKIFICQNRVSGADTLEKHGFRYSWAVGYIQSNNFENDLLSNSVTNVILI